MPNLCDCKVTIQSQDVTTIRTLQQVAKNHGPLRAHKLPLSTRFRRRLLLVLAEMGFRPRHPTTRGPLLLEFLSPMPKDLELRAERRDGLVEAFAKGAEFGDLPDWWRWLIENWGCQHEPLWIDVETPSPEELTLRFATEETAPVAALQAGSVRLGFSFRLTYWDGHHAGWATVEENQEVAYDCAQAPAAQGIPQDLIDDFQLHDVYLRYREGAN
jgi:hypothetical protein